MKIKPNELTITIISYCIVLGFAVLAAALIIWIGPK